ncbi:MAG: 4-hydroxy-tetrahydrodipicolinate synthase [Acidimicrobiia bacterium]
MTSDLDLRGVWVPLITPFDASDAVDLDAVERLCSEYLGAGATGIVALGTTGESSALDEVEKRAVIDTCARACASAHAPLIVGTGTNSTRTTIATTERLGEIAGVAGALVVVPYYVRPSEAGIVAHMQTVADASPVPIVLYNVPYRTGRSLGASALLELAAHPNIAGVKQAVGALDSDTLQLLSEAPRGFAVLGGEDAVIFPTVCMGGLGAIAASAHVCTERVVEMIECGLAGKLEDGRAHAEALLPVVRAGFAEPNPAVFKGVLHAQGRIATPDLRGPMTNASAAAVDACLEAIERASR